MFWVCPAISFCRLRDQRRCNDGGRLATSGHRFPERSGQFRWHADQTHRHPCRLGFSGRGPGAQDQTRRCAFHSSIFPHSQNARLPAKPKLRLIALLPQRSIAGSRPSPANQTAACHRRQRASRWNGLSRCAALTRARPSTDLADAGQIDESLADALGRAVAAAHRLAPSMANGHFPEALSEIIAQNEADLTAEPESVFVGTGARARCGNP